jgi:hypothetical protein
MTALQGTPNSSMPRRTRSRAASRPSVRKYLRSSATCCCRPPAFASAQRAGRDQVDRRRVAQFGKCRRLPPRVTGTGSGSTRITYSPPMRNGSRLLARTRMPGQRNLLCHGGARVDEVPAVVQNDEHSLVEKLRDPGGRPACVGMFRRPAECHRCGERRGRGPIAAPTRRTIRREGNARRMRRFECETGLADTAGARQRHETMFGESLALRPATPRRGKKKFVSERKWLIVNS